MPCMHVGRNGHIFEHTTFTTLRFCCVCGGMVWSMFQSGVRCRFCSKIAHPLCSENVTIPCRTSKEEFVLTEWVANKLVAIEKKLKDEDRTFLNLDNHRLGDDALAGTVQLLLQSNAPIRTLRLECNRLSHKGFASAALLIEHTVNLTALNIAHNQPGSQGIMALADALRTNCTLTDMNIGHNQLSTPDCLYLCAALKSNRTLVSLNLNGNNIEDEGLKELFVLPQLISLDVGCNFCSPSDSIAQMRSLATNAFLTDLTIDGSWKGRMGTEGILALAQTLRVNATILSLNINDNNCGNEGVFAIAHSLQTNKTLRALAIANNNVTDEGGAVIIELLKDRNVTLHELDFRGNELSASMLLDLHTFASLNHHMTIFYENPGNAASTEHEKRTERDWGTLGLQSKSWYGWCSYCWQYCEHIVKVSNSIGRSVYECTGCNSSTVRCLRPSCFAMARHHLISSDDFCGVHCGIITAWGEKPEDPIKWCSWCFTLCKQSIKKLNMCSRHVYTCCGCDKRTLHCRNCTIAMCRGHTVWDDDFCAKCEGSITLWEAEVAKDQYGRHTQIVAWCSWCFEHSTHTRQQKGSMGRNCMKCEACGKKTLKCYKCMEAMARGGTFVDEWFCAKCDPWNAHKKAWEDLRSIKRKVFISHDNRSMQEEMKRHSNFKDMALAAAMERPFLLLVSMDAETRFATALMLGICLLSYPCFGDTHAEAWCILSSPGKGLMSRGNYAFESLNPLGKSVVWYDVLTRMLKVIFNRTSYSQYEDFSAAKISGFKKGSIIDNVENDLLFHIAEIHQQHCDKEHLAPFRAALESNDPWVVEFVARMKQYGEITSATVLLYCLDLLQSVFPEHTPSIILKYHQTKPKSVHSIDTTTTTTVSNLLKHGNNGLGMTNTSSSSSSSTALYTVQGGNGDNDSVINNLLNITLSGRTPSTPPPIAVSSTPNTVENDDAASAGSAFASQEGADSNGLVEETLSQLKDNPDEEKKQHPYDIGVQISNHLHASCGSCDGDSIPRKGIIVPTLALFTPAAPLGALVIALQLLSFSCGASLTSLVPAVTNILNQRVLLAIQQTDLKEYY